jgi:hypothetical protein
VLFDLAIVAAADVFAAADELASTVVLRGAAADFVRLGVGSPRMAPGVT